MTPSSLLSRLSPVARAAVEQQLSRSVVKRLSVKRGALPETLRPKIDLQSWCRGFFVKVATPNPLNGSHGRHWEITKRRREQRARTLSTMLDKPGTLPPLPVDVIMQRCGPGVVDEGSLGACLKSVQDQIADAYGIADNNPRIKFIYAAQHKQKQVGVLVSIKSRVEVKP